MPAGRKKLNEAARQGYEDFYAKLRVEIERDQKKVMLPKKNPDGTPVSPIAPGNVPPGGVTKQDYEEEQRKINARIAQEKTEEARGAQARFFQTILAKTPQKDGEQHSLKFCQK